MGSKSSPELADIIRQYGEEYLKQYNPPYKQLKVMHSISVCRTSALGGHIDKCDTCGHESILYNSCRNRHCPKCQTLAKEKWLDDRKAELLPTGYFHLVFTLPHQLNPIIMRNKQKMFFILFAAVNETLQAFASDPKWRLNGTLGVIAILHTWSQTLIDHYHLHCLIPAGALSTDKKRWIPSRKKFLFRVKSLAKEFRKRFLIKMQALYRKDELIFPGEIRNLENPEKFADLVSSSKSIDWIVYAKRPFAGPEQILEYLGRYTHRVAISNERIKSINAGKVTFTYKDRNTGNIKRMALDAHEFIRRFLLHVLPSGFVKIRYFGFLSHRNKKKCIPLIRKLINPNAKPLNKVMETLKTIMLRLTGIDITLCPLCKRGNMVRYAEILPIPFHHSQKTIWDSS